MNAFWKATANLLEGDYKDRTDAIENDPWRAVENTEGIFTMGERVMAAGVHESRSAWQGGGMVEDIFKPLAKRIPFGGGFIGAAEENYYNKVKDRIMDGSATSADLLSYAEHMRHARERA